MAHDAHDRTLVARAAAGSDSAFRTLYRAYVRPVHWIAYGILGDAGDAEDVTQETFVVAWRKLPALELAGESLLPWLATICRFQAANRLRRRQRDAAHTLEETDERIPALIDVEQQVVASELAERIAAELDGMTALDREIFRLCATEGYDYRAASEELGVGHGVVRNRLSRVRTRLRGAVTETEPAS